MLFRSPFHLQTFDLAALARVVETHGFEVVWASQQSHEASVARLLAKKKEPAAGPTPFPEEERLRRERAWAVARARSIIALPADLRGRFTDEMPQVVATAVGAGVATLDKTGQPVLLPKRGKATANEAEP